MKHFLNSQEWVKLDQDDRRKLVGTFLIGKSGPTQVVNNELISDGTTDKDLQAISIAKMVEYLGESLPWFQENLFELLLTQTINKVNGKTQPSQEVRETEVKTRGRGRPKKETSKV